MATKFIHVNRNVLASNKKRGDNNAPITVKTYSKSRKTCKLNKYGHRVEVQGPSVFVHSEDNPLPCGARVWIETDSPVKIIHDDEGVEVME